MNKRGISGVVVTIMIILVAIIAVTIFWTVLSGVIERGSEDITLETTRFDLYVEDAEIIDGLNASVKISRGSGGGDLSSVKIKLINNQGQSQLYDTTEGLGELETRTYKFELEIGNPTNVELYPVVIVNNEEKIGSKAYSKSTKQEYENLVAYYKFENNADDETGNADGTIYGAGVDFVDGKVGQAIEFENIDGEYVQYDTTLGIIDEITVSSWVKPYSTTQPNGDGMIIIGTYHFEGGGFSRGWSLGDVWNGAELIRMELSAYSSDGSSNTVGIGTGFYSANLNKWTHVVGVLKPNEYIKLFVNGEQVAIQETGIISDIENVYNMRLGARTHQSSQSNWDGAIDEVMIFDRALTEEEIIRLFNM